MDDKQSWAEFVESGRVLWALALAGILTTAIGIMQLVLS